jgi:hypothetical protein
MSEHNSSEREVSSQESPSLEALQRIELICTRFEEAWQKGTLPTLEECLDLVPEPERPALLEQLLPLDIHYRRKAGESPALAEYLPRWTQFEQQLQHYFSTLDTGTVAVLKSGGRVERDDNAPGRPVVGVHARRAG